MVFSLPITGVQAKKVTRFTGSAIGLGPPSFGPVVKQMGVNELSIGTEITYQHTWNSSDWVKITFGTGVIVNTVDSITNIDTFHSIMKGTHVLTFTNGLILTGTFHAKRMFVKGKGWVTQAFWISYGGGYKVIWQFDSRKAWQDSGVIMEM
jgi:hypothetical protein